MLSKVLLFLAVAFLPFLIQGQVNQPKDPKIEDSIKKGYNRFQENLGQMKDIKGKPIPFVLFKLETARVDFYITETGITYIFKERLDIESEEEMNEHSEETIHMKWNRVDLILDGAVIDKEKIEKESYNDQGSLNFFYPHCPGGIYGVKEYDKIIFKDVYPNIDWILYNPSDYGCKYDFVLHPGANSDDIQLIYRSEEKLLKGSNGEIVVPVSKFQLKEKEPSSFLNERAVKSSFNLQAAVPNIYDGYDNHVSFDLSKEVKNLIYSKNHENELIIDPELTWGTFYGGTAFDGIKSLELDSDGNLFATGYSQSIDYPVLDGGSFFQGEYAGDEGLLTIGDVVILKFNPLGERLWVTYYGGIGVDHGSSIQFDSDGNLFIVGLTDSDDFPLEDAGTFFQDDFGGEYDVCILKFDSDGNRLWATYYGGDDRDIAKSSTIDLDGNLTLVGDTRSADFPVQDAGTFYQGAFGGGLTDAFIVKFDNLGNRIWSTYVGGDGAETGSSIDSDSDNEICVVGQTFSGSVDFPLMDGGGYFEDELGGVADGYIMRFDELGNLSLSTFYGGELEESLDGVLFDKNDHIIALGLTHSDDLPLMDAGTFLDTEIDPTANPDPFILKLTNDGEVEWATYFGGDGWDRIGGAGFFPSIDNIGTDKCNNYYFSFTTAAAEIEYEPLCNEGSFFLDTNQGTTNQFIGKFDETGNFLDYTFIGGDGSNLRSPIAVTEEGTIFISGEWGDVTSSDTYPVLADGTAYFDATSNDGDGDGDGFIDGYEDSFFLKIEHSQGLDISVTPDTCNTGVGSITAITNYDITCVHSFYWSTGDEVLNSFDNTHTISDLSPGYYSLAVVSGCDSILIDSIEVVDVFIGDMFDLGEDSAFCGEINVLLTTDVDGLGYEWQDGSSDETFLVTEGGDYWLTVDFGSGCTFTDTISFFGGTLDAEINISNPSCHGFSDGSITVDAEGGDDLIYIITDSNDVQLNVDNSDAANSLSAGWYYIYLEGTDSCNFFDSVFVTDPPPLSAGISLTHPLCFGDSTGIAVVDTVFNAQGDLSNISFIWTPNYSGEDGIWVDSIYNMPAGSYVLTINDDNGCTEVIDFVIEEPPPLEFVELGTDPALCRLFNYQNGNGVVFAAANGGTPDYTYEWINIETLETSDNSTWGGLNPGSYQITATDQNGCTLTDILQLDSINPVAAFSVISDQLDENCEGTEVVEVKFVNESINFSSPQDPDADTTFLWNLNHPTADWSITHDYFEMPDTIYHGEFVYEVCLIAINKNGCEDMACKEIIVHVQPEFTAPNIFTPSGDESNDLFTFQHLSEGVETFSCIIINRWGVTVAELNTITDGWDGTDLNNDLCTDGVYFYKYTAIFTNGTSTKGQGNVHLIRGN